jgi:hypothetical protein
MPVERSGTSMEHDTGSHSVDRIVRVILFPPQDNSSAVILRISSADPMATKWPA